MSPERGGSIDPLSQVLESVRLRGEVLCRSEFVEPWGLALPALDGMYFHIVERGSCWMRLDGTSETLQGSAGDILIVPHGIAHTLCEPADTQPVPLELHVLEQARNRMRPVVASAGAAPTTIVCGSFTFERDPRYRLASLMPPMLRISVQLSGSPQWLEAVVKLISREALAERPGMEIVLRRLTEALFVEALRSWLESQEEMPASWLAALRDATVSRALAAIHREPGRKWTVTALAAEAGLSRSPFALRFTARVGMPPLTYLTRWRMHLASSLLRDTDFSIGQIAARVGYESEAAFNRAFKAQYSRTPGLWRRQITTN